MKAIKKEIIHSRDSFIYFSMLYFRSMLVIELEASFRTITLLNIVDFDLRH